MSMKAGMKAMKEERDRKKREELERSGVDEKGRLAVTGAKKRSALRWFQGLGAIVVGVGSVGATLVSLQVYTPRLASNELSADSDYLYS